MVPGDHEPAEGREIGGGFLEGCEGGEGLGLQARGFGAGGLQTVDGDVGQLALGSILAGGFPKFFGRRRGIEDVVGDLEGEADGFTKGGHSGPLGGGRPGGDGPQFATGADQGRRFAPVDPFQAGDGGGVLVDGGALGVEVVLLATHHPPTAGGPGQTGYGRATQVRAGLEGQGLEGVPRENRRGFVEGLVAGRPTPAQVVIVHGRQVVVDQGVGVQQFHRRQGRGAGPITATAGPGRRQHQGRAQAFSAREHAVPHGLMKPRRGLGGGRKPSVEGIISEAHGFAQQGSGGGHGRGWWPWRGAGQPRLTSLGHPHDPYPMDPTQILLVLLLLADPSAQPAADAVRVRLQDTADSAKIPVRFVVGPEALAQLKAAGISDADLLAGPSVGDAFTKAAPRTAVIRLERRLSGGNVVVESQVWVAGRHESHVAIADSKATEPVESTARGLGQILSPWLTDGAVQDTAMSDQAVARLADDLKWREVLETPATGTPRNGYYRVLALVRLKRQAEAETSLTALRAAHPNHVLTRAAEALVHPAATPAEVDINNAKPADDGGNVLR